MTQCSSFIEKLSGFTGVNTINHASKLMLEIPGYVEQLKLIAGVYIDKNRARSDKEAGKEEAQSDAGKEETTIRDGLDKDNTEIKN